MSTQKKIDLRKELKHLYAPSPKKIAIVEVPPFQYAMVDGTVEPGQKPESSAEFQQSMQALFGISFTLKFMSKLHKVHPLDYAVMPLEGLWWTGARDFDFDTSTPWHFTLMILQPAHITQTMYLEALQHLQKKKASQALSRLRLETFGEGTCIQTLHLGPYDQEAATMEGMKAFAEENQLSLQGRHHEIYLGDPRRCAPEKLRTVLRRPVTRGIEA